MASRVPSRTQARALTDATIEWFAHHARPLPWRERDCTPWGVMVSEFMLQQTPVARVLEPWRAWLERWPTPAALAAEPAGEAVRAWGRLGYPRRALRLHAAAVAITERHGGRVPTDHAELLALPGVGEYTAAAIASFAHGQSHVVLDTNVRRVLARAVRGVERPAASPSRAERELAAALLPDGDADAALWAAASMELGALVCTARTPDCHRCPVREQCVWFSAGRPPSPEPRPRGQSYAGTDRQVRGIILARVRESEHPVSEQEVNSLWDDAEQRQRCLSGLIKDGLLRANDQGFTLP